MIAAIRDIIGDNGKEHGNYYIIMECIYIYIYRGYSGIILGLHGDDVKEHGNYYTGEKDSNIKPPSGACYF